MTERERLSILLRRPPSAVRRVLGRRSRRLIPIRARCEQHSTQTLVIETLRECSIGKRSKKVGLHHLNSTWGNRVCGPPPGNPRAVIETSSTPDPARNLRCNQLVTSRRGHHGRRLLAPKPRFRAAHNSTTSPRRLNQHDDLRIKELDRNGKKTKFAWTRSVDEARLRLRDVDVAHPVYSRHVPCRTRRHGTRRTFIGRSKCR